MILRVLILSVLICLSRAGDGDFMNAVRSLIYGEQGQNSSFPTLISDENPTLLNQDESAYPNPPAFASYPQLTVGISGGGSGSPCGLPQQIGTGPYRIPRWYFNPARMRCELFYWSGCCGNGNNFNTFQACQQVCEESPNPCAYGTSTTLIQCGPGTVLSQTCSGQQFCHVGATPQTTVCCNKPVTNSDRCHQPLNVGVGNSNLPRWYFNPLVQQCQSCVYKGLQGNENNFVSKQDCENSCLVFVNPCNQPIPMPPQMCSAQNPNSCAGNCWCHIGASPSTTVCCPSEGNPCDLPLNRGTGGQSLPRWFYNQMTGSCEPFNYCGLKGNQNNFLTREMCEGMCAPNPCAEGRPFVGVDGRTQTCSASATLNTCPSTYWCHIGADQTTTVCCPGASQNSCNLPMSTGEGNQQLERFYFDSATKTCKPFIYLGLKGNQNNFLTLRSCQLACQPLDNPCIGQPATTPSGQVLFCSATNKDACPVNFWCHLGSTPETTVCCPGATNPCSVPLAPGTGNSGLARWYYNPDDRECVPFQYNGRRGNQNNFVSQAECERTCPEQLCLLSIDRGACGGRQTRYAFNRQTSQCVPFEYTGCGGNLNNFQSMSDCMATCGNVGFR